MKPTDLCTLATHTLHLLQAEGPSVLWASGQREQAADQWAPHYPSSCWVLYFCRHAQEESGLKDIIHILSTDWLNYEMVYQVFTPTCCSYQSNVFTTGIRMQ